MTKTPGNVRALACAAIAAIGCLCLALCGSAVARGSSDIAQGHRSGSDLPRIEERHVAVGRRQGRGDRRHHHGGRHRDGGHHKAGGKDGAGAPTSDDPTPVVGGSTPVSGPGKKDPVPSKPSLPPVEVPPLPPVTVPTPPVPPIPPIPPVEVPAPPTEPPPVQPPTQSTHCFASPHLCGFPDSTNSGVPAGTTLKPSGSLTITRAGTVVSGLQVTGTINVLAANVTIENTRVIQNTTCGTRSTCGNYAIRIEGGISGTTIRHVETASASGDTCEHDIRNTGGTATIEASYLHACDSNVYAVGPTVLKDSYGIGALAISEDHVENVYFNETSFTAIHDTLLNPVEQTAVIFGNSGGGTDVTNCSNQLTVLESLIGGGGYSLYPCAHAARAGTSTLNVQGNHFARCVTAETYVPNGGTHPCAGGADSSGYYAKSGSYGIATNYFSGVGTWRGNVWDDNLVKACIDGRTTGCE